MAMQLSRFAAVRAVYPVALGHSTSWLNGAAAYFHGSSLQSATRYSIEISAAPSSVFAHKTKEPRVTSMWGAAGVFVAGFAGLVFSSSAQAGCFGKKEETPSPCQQKAPKPLLFFILGGPGAGKGTQCQNLVDRYGFVHLSAGDLLRAEQASGSQQGEMIKECIKEGKIVDVKVTLGLIDQAMKKSGKNKFLIDGFPRNADNLQGWINNMGAYDIAKVLVFDCPEEVLEERILARGKSSGRADDNLESLRKRFKVFKTQTRPVVDFYAEQGKVEFISSNNTVEEVFRQTDQIVLPILEQDLLQHNDQLLAAIAEQDYKTFEQLTHPDITAFEAEACGHLVKGIEFHKFYFDNNNHLGSHESTIAAPTVRIFGKIGLVTYTRLIRAMVGNKPVSKAFQETRVWEDCGGRWKCRHFHRSEIKA